MTTQVEKLKAMSINIRSDIEDFFETYNLNEIKNETDLVNYVDELKRLKREHRRIYTQLMEIHVGNFSTHFPHYEEEKQNIADKFKMANENLLTRQHSRNERLGVDQEKKLQLELEKLEQEKRLGVDQEKKLQLELEKLEQEKAKAELEVLKLRGEVESQKEFVKQDLGLKEKLKCDFKMLIDKVREESKEANLDVQDVVDIDDATALIFKFENRLDAVDKIYSDLSGVFVGEMESFEGVRSELISILKRDIERLKNCIKEIKIQDRDDKAKKAETEERAKTDQMIESSKDLFIEIKTRYDTLLAKCEVDLTDLGDFEILKLKKREDSFNLELREFVEKITSYSQFVIPFKDQVEGYKMMSGMRHICVERVSKLFKDVNEVISKNDISEMKLRNVGTLSIELKKFKGHNSDVDIYSFREEFKKHVEPNLQKGLLADCLKKNYLTGSAYSLVAKLDNIDDIWKKLIDVYGNTQLLLQSKICALEKFSSLEKCKDDEKIVFSISELLNAMNDLKKLASMYDLEGHLYYGGGLQKILKMIGEQRKRKFLKSVAKVGINVNEKDKWTKLELFLENERTERENFILNEKTEQAASLHFKNDKEKSKSEKKDSEHSSAKSFVADVHNAPVCQICGKSEGHVISKDQNGHLARIEYFACKKFAELDPFGRMKLLFKKGLCAKCLYPGAKREVEHNCDKKFLCKNTYKTKKGEIKNCQHHVLACGFHASENSNKELLKHFKSKVIENSKLKFEPFTTHINIDVEKKSSEGYIAAKNENESNESAIFMFQRIKIQNEEFNIFFDSGCGDLCVSKPAIDRLLKLEIAQQTEKGPLILRGVGDVKTICEHGAYSVTLPLGDGSDAKMSGLCLDRLTNRFPTYPLENVTREFYGAEIHEPNTVFNLPTLPKEVGGEVDLMIGVQYLKYHPTEVARLNTGLRLYRSPFENVDFSRGVVAGPHKDFSKAERAAHFTMQINPVIRTYHLSIELRNEIPLLTEKGEISNINQDFKENESYAHKRAPRIVKIFEEIENSGTEVNYRCLNCRDCADCRKGPQIENISIQEEVEQQIIEKSVSINFDTHESNANLPFLSDPDKNLASNFGITRKIYSSMVKKLSGRPKDREEVIKSERKMQDLGFVEFLDNLSREKKMAILNSIVQYYIPWLVAWNEKSITTPVRLVFNASQITKSGLSLNDLLAKGTNAINSLIQILIRWRTKLYAFHTDITKMYNAIKLNEDYWRYQLYLWHNDLDPEKEPLIKVIKTLIYGVVPSGNQAIAALRKIAKAINDEFPEVSEVLANDLYVDDCISGAASLEERNSITDDLKICLEKGGFSLKGFTFSGSAPSEKLSENGTSILVGGLKWFPEEDKISLSLDELNFAKKVRGKKQKKSEGNKIPEILTKRICVSKVAECFSPTGIFVPLLSSMKLDISMLHSSGLDWDDRIPDNLREIWKSNFEMLDEMRNIYYKRAIVPPDAKNLDIETIATGDASEKLLCAAVYARFERRNGTYSCQLIFARSKVISNINPPRAELLAALLNATTSHVVEKALGEKHKYTVKLTDSQVALHWICSKKTAMKTWLRNRVVEINRLSDSSLWRHVDGSNMIADLGTRKGAKISDVIEGSPWIQGFEWMSGPRENFPVSTVEQIKLDNIGLESLKKEMIEIPRESKFSKSTHVVKQISSKVGTRYEFSQYLLDPNKFRFRKVVRILSLVMLFIHKSGKNIKKVQESKLFTHVCPGDFPRSLEAKGDKYIFTTGLLPVKGSKAPPNKMIEVTDLMIKAAFYYYAKKASLELKKFVDQNLFRNICKEIDGVLYYSGRILTSSLLGASGLGEAAFDLSKTSFCVPIMDRLCPVAYSIVMETHWYHPDVKHKGIETLLRLSESIAHIIGARTLVKSIKFNCKKCRILARKKIDAIMGPLQEVNLCIAPCFYACQVDIFGPFKSYSHVNKRATIKVWCLIFCCCTTGAVDVRLMDDYSTDSFIQAFIRFSCRFGYPKWVLPDEGSQLVKGCKDMDYSFIDVQQKLSREYGVDYKPCPVGAHYVHGKVERKIRQVRKSLQIKEIKNERLSILQWETLMQQISNSINNLPIGVKNKVECLESLDILTPNRLILGRNNNRCPNAPLELSNDYKRIIEANSNIFKSWFHAWLVSYVPTLVERPKWHKNDSSVKAGDVILFLKSEQEYDIQYQYGIVSDTFENSDGQTRRVEIEYVNHNENTRRKTIRGVRDIVMIYPIDELDIYHELSEMMI